MKEINHKREALRITNITRKTAGMKPLKRISNLWWKQYGKRWSKLFDENRLNEF